MKNQVGITKAEVDHVAQLARLDISESEKTVFSEQLSHILAYVDQLREIETEGVLHTATVLEQANLFRDDVAQPSLSVNQATANAPKAEGDLFVVPKIIGEG
jgi:aspartyl-tRNA(Asn)/glutamyl-tRNA(Gln) amidotransferase subunit C